jgi:hypothetical protein
MKPPVFSKRYYFLKEIREVEKSLTPLPLNNFCVWRGCLCFWKHSIIIYSFLFPGPEKPDKLEKSRQNDDSLETGSQASDSSDVVVITKG